MTYTITLEARFVRAVLIGRETVEETSECLKAIARWSAQQPNVLIEVRGSKPIFQAMRHGLMERFKEIARAPSHRIALTADSMELQASHEYLELLASQQGLRVRSVASEDEAVEWFSEAASAANAPPAQWPETERRREASERRQQAERRVGEDRRKQSKRRLLARRARAS
jgi:hypothetical protein